MRKALALLVFAAAVLLVSPAAAQRTLSFNQMLSIVGQTFNIPPEWDGVWAYDDSTYVCGGPLVDTDAGIDTLCAGAPIVDDGSQPGIMCTGSVDATTVNVTCTLSQQLAPDCVCDLTFTIAATRTGDTYVAQQTLEFTYTGAETPCDFLTDSCERTSTRATRQGPAPSAYCATPVHPSTWGELKVKYR